MALTSYIDAAVLAEKEGGTISPLLLLHYHPTPTWLFLSIGPTAEGMGCF